MYLYRKFKIIIKFNIKFYIVKYYIVYLFNYNKYISIIMYTCNICNYKTLVITAFYTHIKTAKHIKNKLTFDNNEENKRT